MKTLFLSVPFVLFAAAASAYAVEEEPHSPINAPESILSHPVTAASEETCEIKVTADVIAALALSADWRAVPAEGNQTALVCAQ